MYQDDYQKRKAYRIKMFRESSSKKMIVCAACGGSGIYDHNGSPKCGACNGKGQVRQ